jgi:hypothetical protein
VQLNDSERLASIELGYHSCRLLLFLEAAIEGDTKKDGNIHHCIETLIDRLTVLARHFTDSEFSQIEKALQAIGEWHDLANGIGPVSETTDARRAIGKKAQTPIARYKLLSSRAVARQSVLNGWYDLGYVLAEFFAKALYATSNDEITPDCWDRLNSAIDRLPAAERKWAEPFAIEIRGNSLKELARSIFDAYGEICQILADQARLERQQGPTTSTAPADASPPESVVLTGDGKPPIVRGQVKSILTKPQYNVMKALLDAKSSGLTKDQLVNNSGHGDARKILKRLADSDDDWKSVISFPGRPGRRYRLL